MRTAFLCLLCFICTTSWCQDTIGPAPLHFESYAYSFYVTPEGKSIVVTRVGEIAYADELKSLWHKVIVDGSRKSPMSGLTLDNVNFFNNDTGIVSGFISNKGNYDIIYRTTDGGRSWKPIVFGNGGWVDDAVNLPNGEAWMSVSGDGIYYTKDHGLTWQHFTTPEPKQRFANIYFNDAKEGLIGSLYNLLAYTGDNCRSWQFLPTPLDQKAYSKTTKENRPEISEVAILPDIFLVKQEDLVFWSRRDRIEWKLIKGYNHFYPDAASGVVYFKKSSTAIIKTDASLNVLAERKLDCNIIRAHATRGKLFVFSGKEICVIDADLNAVYHPLLTNEKAAIQPAFIGYGEGGTYGNLGRKVYVQKEYREEWEYAFSLPFDVDGGTLTMSQDFILYAKADSLIYYAIASGYTEYVSRNELFDGFTRKRITAVTVERGSRGCFHSYRNSITYVRDYEDFEMANEEVQENRYALQEAPPVISGRQIELFMQQLPALLTHLPTVHSLRISGKDYQQCKADIIAFRNTIGKKQKESRKENRFYMAGNNIDFDRLLNLVDSVRLLQPEQLNVMLSNLNEIWSTTTNWISLSFTNAAGQQLRIANYHYDPNSMLFPWVISLNGYSIDVNSPQITEFVRTAYPALIGKKHNLDILYSLVKQMYDAD